MNAYFSGLTLRDYFPAIALVASFLLGSLPMGIWVARAFHVRDIRTLGSGNIGATNVSRVVGFWPAGFLTFLLDVFKGAFFPLLLGPLGNALLAPALELEPGFFSNGVIWASGLMAVLGHCYSPWLRFNGGKGVATGFGVALVLSPISAAFGLLAFGITFLETKTGSLSSIAGLLFVLISHLVFHSLEPYLWFGALMVAVIIIRHESNLDAILEGKERSF